MSTNVVDTLLQIGNLMFKTANQPFGYFAKENTTFAGRIKKCGRWILKKLLG